MTQPELMQNELLKLKKRIFVHEIGPGEANQVVKITRNHSGEIISSRPFDGKLYSRMKYGDPSAIRTAASDVFNLIVSNSFLLSVFSNHEVVFTNEARDVPTASYCIMVSLVNDFLNPYLVKNYLKPTETVRSERRGEISSDDYASLTVKQRQARVGQRGGFFSPENVAKLTGKKVVLFDDLVITGTYENNQTSLLMNSGVSSDDIIPIYWIQISPEAGKNPTFEKELNQSAVKSLADLFDIFTLPGVQPSERIIKYVLPITDESGHIVPEKEGQLADLCERLCSGEGSEEKAKNGSATLLKLFNTSLSSDGFGTMDRFKAGYGLIESILKSHKIIM
ncbi:TPA: hypothetical protein DIU27_05725 [Candidatus Collierbacteria bacterium]|uniref:Uncharacterized protein n=1 Tax=Candidatus Collierbacteria bacterium GW2011_GWB2_44_22 TaxID=1618387 RepID=A0A0G1HYX7_9BACT|nr:MAG: hypothetical protein UW31_C0015G0007 [Candidatus Collierbacteria bacterium GW2011_GWA2_44_13]KKT48951.1 MAG: hypothetical protein UW42_C0043G0002 [Candidatus Collierbacteria bacterium GW2011_GWB1_44_197]KKT52135.1 MAG: hypothetical protein UW44_C0004G0040 [Candidatus Collierbacteria bacterium GW2011_GWB2_44_22]KKT61785.1 MAG: hypothetical protein UW56_C0018G0015 [Candidatus Collierbacteria bacterium GW2011_GWD1_44_27]KKT65701.1 MAG: hypothetical protein UW58_C0022G0007 [Candidatus Colli